MCAQQGGQVFLKEGQMPPLPPLQKYCTDLTIHTSQYTYHYKMEEREGGREGEKEKECELIL